MDIRVNGKSEDVSPGITVKGLLDIKELDPAMVSVEYNGKILEKTDLDSTVLVKGDEIEVLFFMGGGGCH